MRQSERVHGTDVERKKYPWRNTHTAKVQEFRRGYFAVIRFLFFQKLFERICKLLDIIIRLLLPPESTVIAHNLTLSLTNRKPADEISGRRQSTHAFYGQKAPAADHKQPSLFQAVRKQIIPAKSKRMLVVFLFCALLLPGRDKDTRQPL